MVNPTFTFLLRVLLVLVVYRPSVAGELEPDHGVSATFSIVAVDPENRERCIAERIACEQLSEIIRSADRYIDLHSRGTLFSILPMSGYMLHPDETILKEQRSLARAFNLPLAWGTTHIARSNRSRRGLRKQAGTLVVARSFTRVKAGESVGGILETEQTHPVPYVGAI